MYVSAWQGLSPALLLRRSRTGSLPYPLSAPDTLGFHVARNAIYHAIRALRLEPGSTVLAPAYHSGNEIKAIRAAGAQIRYYSIDRRLEPDLAEMEGLCDDTTRVLFVIHYVGWAQPMDRLMEFCRKHGLVLVEDCALAFLSETGGRPLGSFGSSSIFCLYKTLPIPNGGILCSNTGPQPELTSLHLRTCGSMATMGRVAELSLEWLRTRCDLPGRILFACKRGMGNLLNRAKVERVPVGDMGFDIRNVDMGMSPLPRRLLGRFDYAAIRERRRENFARMQELLDGKATLLDRRLEPGMCPLFFPILVPDKGRASRELKRHGIMATEFWNQGEPDAVQERFADTKFLRDHLLEIPIHQDIRARHLEYTARKIVELGLRLG